MKVELTEDELFNKALENPETASIVREYDDRESIVREFIRGEMPIIHELRKAGYGVYSLQEILDAKQVYEGMWPVLLRWFPIVEDVRIKDAIVGIMNSPKSPYRREIASSLIAEFPKEENDTIRWAIGNALVVMADDEVFAELRDLVQNKRFGKGREMLVVALGGMRKTPEAVGVLVKLLDDEELTGHAIIGLRKLKAVSAIPEISKYVNHEKTWVRNEAKKAMKELKSIKDKKDPGKKRVPSKGRRGGSRELTA